MVNLNLENAQVELLRVSKIDGLKNLDIKEGYAFTLYGFLNKLEGAMPADKFYYEFNNYQGEGSVVGEISVTNKKTDTIYFAAEFELILNLSDEVLDTLNALVN